MTEYKPAAAPDSRSQQGGCCANSLLLRHRGAAVVLVTYYFHCLFSRTTYLYLYVQDAQDANKQPSANVSHTRRTTQAASCTAARASAFLSARHASGMVGCIADGRGDIGSGRILSI